MSEERRIVNCALRRLKTISWTRVIGAGKRKAISASLNFSRGCAAGEYQAKANCPSIYKNSSAEASSRTASGVRSGVAIPGAPGRPDRPGAARKIRRKIIR